MAQTVQASWPKSADNPYKAEVSISKLVILLPLYSNRFKNSFRSGTLALNLRDLP